MASSYKWPLIALFTAATVFSIWLGKQMALRQATAGGPLVADPNVTLPQSENAVRGEAGQSPAQTPQQSSSEVSSRQSPSREFIQGENQNDNSAIAIEQCTITMAQVDDPRPPLSIREQPSPDSAVVGEVDNGQFIDVDGSRGEWFSVSEPVRGWAPRELTRYACNQKVARVEFARGQRSTDLEGIFIGTGTHRYKLRASRNQTLTLDGEIGPMPRLIGPRDRVLFAGPEEGDPDTWSGELPREGDYILELDSNFRGYPYRFNVRID